MKTPPPPPELPPEIQPEYRRRSMAVGIATARLCCLLAQHAPGSPQHIAAVEAVGHFLPECGEGLE